MTQNKPFPRQYLILVLSILFFGIIISLVANITLRSSAVHDANAASDPLVTNRDNPINQSTSVPSITPSPYIPASEPELIDVPEEPVADRVIIQFSPDSSEEERAAYIESLGGTVSEEIEALDTVVVTVPGEVAAKPLPASPVVAGSEPDHYVAALDSNPNDPRYPEQWALPAIGAPNAWQLLPVDAPSVTVAVIDSGICADHPDLDGRIDGGWDFLEGDANPQDDFGHGCSVAGVIAANINDGIGIAGIAPNARIMPLRVLDASGIGSYSNVAAAVVYAADNGAQILNLSLGGPYPSSTLESAIAYAVAKDVIVVAAAGNSGIEGALYPAAYPGVIAVGSVDPNLQHSSFSNYGPQVNVWAPGRDILVLKHNGGHALASGTSFAAPHVAGLIVLEIASGQDLVSDSGLVHLEETPLPPTEEVPVSENTITVIGTLTTVFGDPPADGSSITAGWLTDDQGKRYKLLLDVQTAFSLNRRRVRVVAEEAVSGTSNQEASIPVLDVLSIEAVDDSESLSEASSFAVTGSHPWVNILCRFADSAGTTPHPLSYYNGLLGGNPLGMDHYWREISYDMANVAGSGSYGWFNLPFPRSTYVTIANNEEVADLGRLFDDCTAVADATVNFNDYDGINLMFNQGLDCCAWGGSNYASLDGLPERLWRTTWLPPWGQSSDITAHEMGHGFGLPHSSGPYGQTYDSAWDVMSAAGGICTWYDTTYGCAPEGTISYHLALLEWIPPSRQIEVTSPTTVRLERLDQPLSGTSYLMAKIPISSTTRYYTVEARQWVGYDQNVPGQAVVIHNVTPYNAQVVDPDGNGNVNDEGAMWLVGETFVDPFFGISVSVVSADATGYTVSIDFVPVIVENDNFTDALEIPAVPFTHMANTTDATTEASDPITSCGSAQHSNSVWYKYTPPTNGLLNINTFGSEYDTVVAVWRGLPGSLTEVACNDNSISTQSYLEIPATGDTLYYIEVMGAGSSGGGILDLDVDFAQTPTYDDFDTPQVVSETPFYVSADTRGATLASDDPPLTECNLAPGQATVWYSYTAQTNGDLLLDTLGSSYDTMLAVWTGARGSLVSVGCNDDFRLGDRDSRLSVPAAEGTTYYIEVSQFNGLLNPAGLESDKEAEGSDLNALYFGGQLQFHLALLPTPLEEGLYQETHPNIVYNSNWTVYSGDGPSGGSLLYSDDPESSAVFRYIGSAVKIYRTMDPVRGLMDVCVDGSCQTVDSYSPSTLWAQPVTFTGESSYEVHTVEIHRIYGRIDVDAIEVSSPVPTPTLISPVDGSLVTDSTPTLDWGNVPGAVLYQVQMDNDMGFSSPVVETTTTVSVYTRPTALADGTYYWRVRARNAAGHWSAYSSTWSMLIDIHPPAAPALISPANGEVLANNTPEFDWSVVGDAVQYQLQIDDSSSFSSPLVVDTPVSSSVYTPASALPDKIYYWRVRAQDAAGLWSTYSPVWRMTVDTIPPLEPVLNSPANRARVPSRPTLSTLAVTGAKQYRFQVSEDIDFTSTLVNELRTTTSYTLTADQTLSYGRYFWRMQAVDAAGNTSDWSAVRSFAVTIQTGPADGSYVTKVAPTYTWAAVSGALEYHLQVDRSGTFANPMIDHYQTGGTSYVSPTLDYGMYYWQMRVRTVSGWSGWMPIWWFTVTVAPSPAPVLTSPANGAILNDNTPTLTWNAVVSDAEYEVQIDNLSTFASPEIWYTSYTEGLSFTAYFELPDGVYYWRMRTLNYLNVAGPWGAVRRFTIDTTPPAAPVLRTPADGASVVGTPTYIWLAPATATRYKFRYGNTDCSDENQVYTSPELTTTSHKPPTQAPGDYAWCAQARDAAGTWSGWSASRTVTVQPPKPAAPVLAAPANGLVTNNAVPVVLSWNSVTYGSTYEVQVGADSTFTTLVRNPLDIVGVTYTVDPALPDGVYYWRVRAVNVNDVAGPWSAVRRFTIDTTPPAAPVLRTPADGASVVGTPAYVWLASATATRYKFRYGNTDCSDENQVYTSPELTTTSHKPPTQAPGDYAWCAQARDAAGTWSGWSASRTVTVQPPKPAAPVLAAPANGLVTNNTVPVVLSWNSVTYGSTYEVQVGANSTFTTLVRNPLDIVGVTYTVDPDLPDGVYYWRIRAVNVNGVAGPWSAVRRFTIDTTPPAAPVLRTPADGASVVGTPTYIWLASATATRYKFRYGNTDCSDENQVYTSPELTTTSHKPPTQVPGDYAWCAQARDAAGTWSDWSASRIVTVQPLVPQVPTLASPANGSISRNRTPVLTWNAVPYGATYEVEMDDNSTFSSQEFAGTSTTNSITPDPLDNGVYYWRVRSRNTLGTVSPWSVVWRVTVRPLPLSPVLLAPADASIDTTGMPTFRWETALNAAYYYIEVASDVDFNNVWWSDMLAGTTWTIPSPLDNGVYYWRVVALNDYGEPGERSEIRTITVSKPPAAPALSSQVDGLTGTTSTPTFSWESVANAATYQIQVDDSADFSSPEFDDTADTTSRTLVTPLANGDDVPIVYSWRVRAISKFGTPGEWSATQTLTVDVPPAAPNLLAPADASTEAVSTPTFSWESVENGATYQIQVDDSADFSSPELDDTADTTSRTLVTPLANGVYSWRVRAISKFGTPGEWSATQTLTVDVPPAAPNLLAPADASTEAVSTPTFSWESVENGATYQIQVDDSADFSSPELDDTADTTSRTPAAPLADGDDVPIVYSWRVRAISEFGTPGEWSATQTLTVDVPPSTPNLLAPADASTEATGTPTFSWESVENGATYQIQVDDSADFSSPEFDDTADTTSRTPATLLANGDDVPIVYYWRVRAINASDAPGEWSEVRTIIVAP